MATLASWLKQQGYRTICIHPYPASFYQRNRVFPLFGFDEFLDIKAFADVGRTGPYIGDLAVADKVASVLEQATGQAIAPLQVRTEDGRVLRPEDCQRRLVRHV